MHRAFTLFFYPISGKFSALYYDSGTIFNRDGIIDSCLEICVVVFGCTPAELCAVRLETVVEIVPMATLICPPNRPALIEGFLNLAGSAIPVVRLDRLFGFAERAVELHTPLLIIRSKAGPLALWIDRVFDVRTAAESATLAVDPGSLV